MVNKKTMSVHNSAHLFIVNTADVPLTYRSPSAPPVFFIFFISSFDKENRVTFLP